MIDDFAEHPFLDFLRLDLPISLSTDNEGMFITDICNECMVAVQNTDITHAELKQMSYNSLETAFASDEVKQELILELEAAFVAFENDWAGIAAVNGAFSEN